jgi:hypothetical protein
MWDAIAWARRAASFRRHSLERKGDTPAGDTVADHFRLFMIPGMDHCGLPAQTRRGITEAGFDPRPPHVGISLG